MEGNTFFQSGIAIAGLHESSGCQLNPPQSITLSKYSKLTVAILSDSHGIIDPRITDIVTRCDVVVHAGDICDAKIFAALRPRKNLIYAVRGNNDLPTVWGPDQTAILERIPDHLEIELPGGLLRVEHGHRHGHHQPCHDSLRNSARHARVIVYGHTHKRVLDDSQQPWLINPGASGTTRTHGGPGCALLKIDVNDWRVELLTLEPSPQKCS